MKKYVSPLLVALLISCLALTGCGQSASVSVDSVPADQGKTESVDGTVSDDARNPFKDTAWNAVQFRWSDDDDFEDILSDDYRMVLFFEEDTATLIDNYDPLVFAYKTSSDHFEIDEDIDMFIQGDMDGDALRLMMRGSTWHTWILEKTDMNEAAALAMELLPEDSDVMIPFEYDMDAGMSYEPQGEEPVQSGEYFQLDGMEIVGMGPFVDGIGWIQYYEGAEMYTAAVEEDGHVLFKVPGPVWYVSPFEDGTAFMVVSDNASHFTGESYLYEQKQDSGWHEVIVDMEGNELYSTARIDTSTSTNEEHILCAGEGKFVALRYSSGLQSNEWKLGTIDKDGNVINEFVHYSIDVPGWSSAKQETNAGLLPNWKNSKTLPSYYYFREDAGAYSDNGFPRYIGEGVFYLPGGRMLYQPDKQLVTLLEGDHLMSNVFDGKVISKWNTDTYYLQDVDSSEGQTVRELKETQYAAFSYKDSAMGDLFPNIMLDNKLYHDHAYFDIGLNRAIQIADYPELPMEGSCFSDGYALLRLKGVDDNYYVTVIDETGAVQFEPFKIKGNVGTSPKISEGYFVANDGTDCAVYDVHGNYIRRLCSGSDVFRIPTISSNFVMISFNGIDARLYALNP